MRHLFASLVAISSIAGLSAAPIPKEKAKSKDAEAIQGTWQVEKVDFGGGGAPPFDSSQMKFTFKDGKLKVKVGEKDGKEGEYKLDTEASPKSIDMSEAGRLSPGIYELDGDTLKICLAEGNGATRPTEMKAEGMRVAVVTLKRVKADK